MFRHNFKFLRPVGDTGRLPLYAHLVGRGGGSDGDRRRAGDLVRTAAGWAVDLYAVPAAERSAWVDGLTGALIGPAVSLSVPEAALHGSGSGWVEVAVIRVHIAHRRPGPQDPRAGGPQPVRSGWPKGGR